MTVDAMADAKALAVEAAENDGQTVANEGMRERWLAKSILVLIMTRQGGDEW